MSYRVVDERGNVRRRAYPLVSFRASKELLELIEAVMKKYNWSKSEAVVQCILAGLDEYKKECGIE